MHPSCYESRFCGFSFGANGAFSEGGEPPPGTWINLGGYTYSTSSTWGDLLVNYEGQRFGYDDMGNRRYDDSWGYHWRKGRQLTWMFGDYEEWVFSYNADGMRTGRLDEVSEKEYTYYYNGSLLRVMTVDGNKLYFVYDAAGTPIQLAYTPAGSTTASYYYYVTNLQGDVIAILNSSGYSVVEYTYDAWGKVLSITGSMASTLGVQNPLRYRSYVYDQETSLYCLQSRYYDPEIGRFINADALVSTGQGLLGNNMFAYCNNNPVNGLDATGHSVTYSFLDPNPLREMLRCGDGGGAVANALGYIAGAVATVMVVGTTKLLNRETDTQEKALSGAVVVSPTNNAVYYGADKYGGTWKIVTPGMDYDTAYAWVVTTAVQKNYGKGASWGIYTATQADALKLVFALGGPGPEFHTGSLGQFNHYHPAGMILFGQYKHFHVWYGSINKG